MGSFPIYEFLKYIKIIRRYSIHTIIAYKTDLKQFSEFYKKSETKAATSYDVENWKNSLQCKGYKERSINRKIATLKSFFKYQDKRDNIFSGPSCKIPKLKYDKKQSLYIKEKKLIEILDEFEIGENRKRIRDKLILELLYFTACRVDEIINLKKTNIDYVKMTIKVLGKGNKERLLPISERIIKLINIYSKKWKSKNRGNFLLNDNRGKKLYPMFIWRLIRRHFPPKELEIFVSAHTLRHSTATHLYNHGVPLKNIQQLLGHSNLSSTAVYIHLESNIIKQIHNNYHPKGLK